MCFFLVIESQNKANKARLRNLQKARQVFENHLGLEIRAISKLQTVKGVTNKHVSVPYFSNVASL